jgi:hypothetical protein
VVDVGVGAAPGYANDHPKNRRHGCRPSDVGTLDLNQRETTHRTSRKSWVSKAGPALSDNCPPLVSSITRPTVALARREACTDINNLLLCKLGFSPQKDSP